MFRQGLRRLAQQASTASSASLLRARIVPTAGQGALRASRLSAPLKSIPCAFRTYSSESAAQEHDNASKDEEPAVEFESLRSAGVHDNLLSAIIDTMQYQTMSHVQAKTIQPALKGTDIVAQARTGTGKTLAFLLPLFQRMINEDPALADRESRRNAKINDIRGIVMSPTRELAEQIAVEARKLAHKTGIVVQTAVGGTQKSQALRQMQQQGCHLLVATPGRLNDLLNDPYSGVRAPDLAAMVLDEADRMLDVGFEQQINEIIRALPSTADKVRQTILVSATIPDNVIRLARAMVRQDDFEFVQTIGENETLTHDKIPQYMVPVSSWGNMFPALFELIDREFTKSRLDPNARPFKAIVYFNTSATVTFAAELAFQMRKREELRIPTYQIQGKRTQVQRFQAAEAFRRMQSAVLFSSDVTARGMDFPDVTHVIQIDLPVDRETYIHRIGRTGRQDKEGEGWLFLPPGSISPARRALQGLPIHKNESLECASSPVGGDEPWQRKLSDAYRVVNPELFRETYTTLLGVQGHSTVGMVSDLNTWATDGIGMEKPPPVSSHWAARRNLTDPGLNIVDGFGREPRFSNRGSTFEGDFRGGKSGFRNMSDPFSSIQRTRRDSSGPRRQGLGRGGGNGFRSRGDGSRSSF